MTEKPAHTAPTSDYPGALSEYLTRHSPDHITVLDRDLRLRYINHTAPGIDREAAIGKSILDFALQDVAETFEARIRQVFVDRETMRWEGSLETPHGRRHYDTIAGPIIENGEVVAVILIARDITELFNLQIQHSATSRLATIGELAAGIGHEINNPLMALTGHLISVQDALDDAGVTDKSVHDKLRSCEDSVARIARIVRGLRRFSRSSDGDDVFDVNRSVEETTEFLANIFGFRAITFELDFGDANVHCQGDAAVFQQVLTNIFINARDALQDASPPTVVVRTRLDQGKATIEVEDNGPGIPEKILPHVFDAFYSTRNKETANGMGLTLARSIVESMGGKIEASNVANGGALFRITLPAQQVSFISPSTETEWKDQQLERGRVLIVDDDESVLDAVSFLLEDLGFHVSSRSDPTEALRVVEQDTFDIVISDRQMPGMSGEVFVQQAHQRIVGRGLGSQPRYFLLSGWHDPDHTEGTKIQLGGIEIGLIGKPVTRAELASHLATER